MVTDGDKDQSEEPTAEALLPWYVNGSLGIEERSFVERWLRGSSDARGRLQQWQCIAQNVAAIHSEDVTSSADQGDAAARVRKEMHSDDINRRRTAPKKSIPGRQPKRRKTELFYLTCFAALLVATALTLVELIRRS